MAHEIVPEAEAILDRQFDVLDHGFVRLVDYLGGDQRIVQSARVSYGEGTKSYRQDSGLINYLLRNHHTSPFEQVIFTFHTRMPIFVARQWVRHRTARLNEISGRYSVMREELYLPDGTVISPQATDNKQGRALEGFDAEEREAIRERLRAGQAAAWHDYEDLLGQNVARELARINLPLATYTEWYWQIDLHNLFHFLKLRLDQHAQYEIRAYADVMFQVAQAVCPIACAAFDEHIRGAVTFSRAEFAALQRIVGGGGAPTHDQTPTPESLLEAAAAEGIEGRALDRFVEKVRTGRMT